MAEDPYGIIIVRRAEAVQSTGNVTFDRYARDGRGRFAPKAAGGGGDGGYTPGGYAGMQKNKGKSGGGGGAATPPKSGTSVKRTKNLDNADATLDRADAQLSAKFKDGEPGSEALIEYVGNGYKPMNDFARTGKSGLMNRGAAKHVKNLDDAFESHGVMTDAPITVHRGVSGSYAGSLGKLKPGDVITERGFMSTSASAEIPKKFAGSGRGGRGGSGGGGKILEINAPPGKRVLAGAHSERELIFPRNTQLKYVGTSPSGAIQFDVI